jgi:uncharacterized protein YggT (Ycf19 family)
MSADVVAEFERRAVEAEASKVPTFIRIARTTVKILYGVVIVILVFLLVAFVLRLFGASTDAGFTRWIYRNAESALRPFRGIFPSREFGDASVLDVSLLFGGFVYLLVAIGADAAVHSLTQRLQRREVEIAQARAQADHVRVQVETQRAEAEAAYHRQVTASQIAAQELARQQAVQAQQTQQRSPGASA